VRRARDARGIESRTTNPEPIVNVERRAFLQTVGGAVSFGAFARASLAGSAPGRLDRSNLLLYHDAQGNVRPVRSRADWERRRAEIVRGMHEVMGRLPGDEKRCPLEMRVEEEVETGNHVRRFITYASEPGSRTPAYLLVPKAAVGGGVKAPAVLCLHPTDNKIGHKNVVGLGGKPNRHYAAELADRGFVTIAPSYPLLADYQPDVAALGWQSGTLKAVWDNMRGLDLLTSLPYVAAGAGFGAIGHSLGGHNSVFTAVLDARIKTVVSSCGLDSFLDYYGGDPKVWQPEKGWCQTRYMPQLSHYAGRLTDIPFDFHELVGALAPRRCFISAPMKDSNFKWDSVDRVARAASAVYKLLGKPHYLVLEHPDVDHDFPDAMREKAYGLLAQDLALRPRS
jgi:dienelactone hydrolase